MNKVDRIKSGLSFSLLQPIGGVLFNQRSNPVPSHVVAVSRRCESGVQEIPHLRSLLHKQSPKMITQVR